MVAFGGMDAVCYNELIEVYPLAEEKQVET